MDSLKTIWEGWKNDLFPSKELKEQIEIVAQERLLICQECPSNSNKAKENGYKTIRKDYHCTICLCPLNKKVKALHANCPINRWNAVLSEKESEEIRNQLNIKE